MRTFPSAFATQLARRDGAAPVWLLKFTAGAAEYVLCQDAVTVTPWSVTALPWIASWGGISEGVDGTLADYRISDLTVSLINDPSSSPNLRTLAKARQLIGINVSVYLWFDGCTDAPQEMFRFRVRDIDLPSLAQVELELQDESIRYESYYPGTAMTLEAYPFADPDDIGKTIPLVFGSISKSLTLAADAGAMTSLPSAIAAAATSITVSDASEFFSGMTIQVDDEQMTVTGKSGDALAVTRGVGGTLAAAHQAAAIVWEVKSEFIYLVADHPVTSIPKAYGRVGQVTMDISGICTVWPAADHPDYPGKAVLSVPGYITVAQAVDLLVQDGIGVSDLLTILDGIDILDGISISDNIGINDLLTILDSVGVNDAIAVSDVININDAGHGHTTSSTSTSTTQSPQQSLPKSGWSFLSSSNPTTYYSAVTISFANPGTITASTITLTVTASGGNNRNGTFRWRVVVTGNGTYSAYTSNTSATNLVLTLPITNTAAMQCHTVVLQVSNDTAYSGNYGGEISAASRSVTYIVGGSATTVNTSYVTKTGSVDKTGTVTKTGSVTRDGSLTKSGTVTRDGSVTKMGAVTRESGVFKTGTVTLTGNSVANTLIGDAILVDVTSPTTAPADVVGQILGTTCQVKGTFPEGYAFNGQINTSRTALEWCHDLARQCRSWFRFILGTPTLIVRPDAFVPVGSVACVRLSGGEPSHGQRLTAIDDVINTITLCYDRDWSDDGSSEPYRCTVSGSDADSIAAYGTRQRPELFSFDFVTSYAMADSLLQFYLRWYAWQRWQHTQEAYLFNASLEFGDVVTLAFDEGQIGEVAEVGFNPGNGTSIDTIQLTVTE